MIGGTGPSATTIYPAILNSVLKTKFKIVAGYRGSGEIMLAMERGEAEGVCLSWDTLKTLQAGLARRRQAQADRADGAGAHRRSSRTCRPPSSSPRPTTDRKMLALYFGPNEMGRPYMGPPDVPKDRLLALRRAFDATMKDPAYLAEAKSQKMDVDPMTGEEMETADQDLLCELAGAGSAARSPSLEPVSREELIHPAEHTHDGCCDARASHTGARASRCRWRPRQSRRPTSPTSTAARPCASWSATGPAPAMTCTPACSGVTSSRYVPGQPTVVIQNMPGAASLTMTNYMYNVAARDGTAIGLPARGLFIEPLFGNENAKFEAQEVHLDRQHEPRRGALLHLAHERHRHASRTR